MVKNGVGIAISTHIESGALKFGIACLPLEILAGLQLYTQWLAHIVNPEKQNSYVVPAPWLRLRLMVNLIQSRLRTTMEEGDQRSSGQKSQDCSKC
jgi:hypothetical protein